MSTFRFTIPLLFILTAACSDSTPRVAFEQLSQASQKGDWETVYALLEAEERNRIDSLVQVLIITGQPATSATSSLLDAPAADRFAAIADDSPELYRRFDFAGYTLVDENTTGDRAILTIRLVRGQEQQVSLVRMRRENGKWRVGF